MQETIDSNTISTKSESEVIYKFRVDKSFCQLKEDQQTQNKNDENSYLISSTGFFELNPVNISEYPAVCGLPSFSSDLNHYLLAQSNYKEKIWYLEYLQISIRIDYQKFNDLLEKYCFLYVFSQSYKCWNIFGFHFARNRFKIAILKRGI